MSLAKAFLCFAITLPSYATPWDSLLKNNPFETPAVAKPAGGQDMPFSCQSMFIENGVAFFSIRDRRVGTSTWLKMNDTKADLSLVSYDPSIERITARYQGQIIILALEKSDPMLSAVRATTRIASASDQKSRSEKIQDLVEKRKNLRKRLLEQQRPPV